MITSKPLPRSPARRLSHAKFGSAPKSLTCRSPPPRKDLLTLVSEFIILTNAAIIIWYAIIMTTVEKLPTVNYR
jgi:hypothetical protein